MIFRCDATRTGGAGHVMRCLALAETAHERGLSVRFVCNQETLQIAPALGRAPFPVSLMTTERINDAVTLVTELATRSDILVIDSYDLPTEFELECRRRSLRVLVIDDLAARPRYCDWLLNAAPGFDHAAYADLAPATSRLLLGTQFALIHPMFLKERSASLDRRRLGIPARRILIAFGLTDPNNGTGLALRAASALPNVEIDVALGAAAPHIASVVRHVEALGARLHVDALNMPALLRDADLAIGAGGTSTWERCALGLPSIIVSIASNQVRIAKAAAAAGVAIDLGVQESLDVEHLREQTIALAQNDDLRASMSIRAAQLIDGRGAARVLDEVSG